MLKKINLFIVVSLGICFSLALVKEWKDEFVGSLSADQSMPTAQVSEDSEPTSDEDPWLFGASHDELTTPNTPKTHKWIVVTVEIENNSAQPQDPKGLLRLKMSKIVTQDDGYLSIEPFEEQADWDKTLIKPGETREVRLSAMVRKTTDARKVRLITDTGSLELDL